MSQTTSKVSGRNLLYLYRNSSGKIGWNLKFLPVKNRDTAQQVYYILVNEKYIVYEDEQTSEITVEMYNPKNTYPYYTSNSFLKTRYILEWFMFQGMYDLYNVGVKFEHWEENGIVYFGIKDLNDERVLALSKLAFQMHEQGKDEKLLTQLINQYYELTEMSGFQKIILKTLNTLFSNKYIDN